MEQIIEWQSLIRDRAFAAFSMIAKALASRNKSFHESYVVKAWAM